MASAVKKAKTHEQILGNITVNLMELFRSNKSTDISLSGKEIALLDALKRNGSSGLCAADVARLISNQTGKEPRLATLYSAITDLERKKLVREAGHSAPDQGGRPRRLFVLTEAGHLAHSLGEVMAGTSRALMPA